MAPQSFFDPPPLIDPPAVRLGREICGDLAAAERREWLVANGLGGFACGTIAGLLTRRYHGLLVAALRPPLGRTLLVTKLDETAEYAGERIPLFSNRWSGGAVDPHGYLAIERFYLDGTTPVWNFAIVDALLEKCIWMEQGKNTTFVRYRLLRGGDPLRIELKAFVNYRDYHGATTAGDWRMEVTSVENGLRVKAFDAATPFFLLSEEMVSKAAHDWTRGFDLAVERYRGLGDAEDHLLAGLFQAELAPGDIITIVASTESDALESPALEFAERWGQERAILHQFDPSGGTANPPWIRQLALAANQFVVSRPLESNPDGKTVIAGYPWFGDWGRDTMISLPGLTLSVGRPELARDILLTFARFSDRGMLPNVFLDAGETAEYNTVDAALWYFEAVRQYYEATEDQATLESIYPILAEIVEWHVKGTRYGIRVDPHDGLLHAGEPGVQLTWMDAKAGDWVVTPRIGKPVEINALWLNALDAVASFANEIKRPNKDFRDLAQQGRTSFQRFWNPKLGYCYDVIDGPEGDDASLRPNQILAVALSGSALSLAQREAVLDVCGKRLLTSFGLRSLAPGQPSYQGHYGGGPVERDGSYHQGAVWAWLIGSYVQAHLRIHCDPRAASAFLAPLEEHLSDHGLGSISEIFDGDPPHTPRGCFAQAWSVAEALRAWRALHSFSAES